MEDTSSRAPRRKESFARTKSGQDKNDVSMVDERASMEEKNRLTSLSPERGPSVNEQATKLPVESVSYPNDQKRYRLLLY